MYNGGHLKDFRGHIMQILESFKHVSNSYHCYTCITNDEGESMDSGNNLITNLTKLNKL